MGYVVASAQTSGLLGQTARQRSSLVDAMSIDPRDAEKGRGEEFANLGRQFDRSEPELVPQERIRTPDPIITNDVLGLHSDIAIAHFSSG